MAEHWATAEPEMQATVQTTETAAVAAVAGMAAAAADAGDMPVVAAADLPIQPVLQMAPHKMEFVPAMDLSELRIKPVTKREPDGFNTKSIY